MKILLTLFLLTWILSGCSKSSFEEDEYYTVTGQVLDLDTNMPIPGAKAYLPGMPPADSATTDAFGRVSFTYRFGFPFLFFYVVKDGYLRPGSYWVSGGHVDRTDTFFLAKRSMVNVTASRTGTYQSTDTVELHVFGDNTISGGESSTYRLFHRDNANTPDKTYNLFAVYYNGSNTSYWNHFIKKEKLYFRADILRNGSVISTKTDSTGIIRYGTRNFTLNY